MYITSSLASKKRKTTQYVVRLTTSYWKDRRGIHTKKSLVCLRRKSYGSHILEEDADAMDVGSVFNRIENLYDCDDGIYEVVICNEIRDWESGIVEDYDYKLIPLAKQPLT